MSNDLESSRRQSRREQEKEEYGSDFPERHRPPTKVIPDKKKEADKKACRTWREK